MHFKIDEKLMHIERKEQQVAPKLQKLKKSYKSYLQSQDPEY